MTKSIQKFSTTQEENMKYLWHQPCTMSGINSILASWKQMQRRRLGNVVQNSVRLHGGIPRIYEDREQNLCCPKLMKIALHLKDSQKWHIKKFGAQVHPNAAGDEGVRMQRVPWKRMEKARGQFQLGTWRGRGQVMSKKEVILEAQRDKIRVHFVSLMDTCHFKNAELEPKLQKYKGRVVLPGETL